MDIDSFRDGEQFSTFDTHNFMDLYPDHLTALDTPQNFHQSEMYQWNMDVEREINGDIALIPMCDIPISMLNDSSPNSDEFQRIINDWQQFICPDLIEEFRIDEPMITPVENEDEMIHQAGSPLHDFLNIPDVESFDLTSYIAADESIFPTTPAQSTSSTNPILPSISSTNPILPSISSANPIPSTSSTNPIQSTSSKNLIQSTSSTNCIQSTTASTNLTQSTSFTIPWTSTESKLKAPVKKIDLKANCYIFDEDEDEVDVETVSENGDTSAVLEACDLNSLLEQFEATVPDLPLNLIENDSLFNMQIEPNQMMVQSNFTTDGSTVVPSNIEVEQINDTLVKIKEEQIDIGEIVLSIPNLPKSEQKCNMAVKTEMNDIDNERHVLSKLDIKNIKKEYHEFNIVKVKNEPTSRKKKTKNKIKSNRENIKTENEMLIQQKTCKVKVEPYVPISEMKHRKTEQVKQTTRIHVDTKPNTEKQITSAPAISKKTIKNEFTPTLNKAPSPKQLSPPGQCNVQKSNHKGPESTTSPTQKEPADSKHIIDSLPQELIDRIKESGKRKIISVIPPIPAKKRGGPRAHDTSTQVVRNKVNKTSKEAETVQLDHDYCSLASPSYPKRPIKEPACNSTDEDDRPTIGKQPTVKNADGTLMVSLLKVNTIHSKESNQKKKLNLEEYKKRRVGFMKSKNNSQNSSPISNSGNSPIPEDENTKRIRHQEKLMKMAMEVLNTPAKPEKKPELPIIVTTPPPPIKIPVDIEKKTLVSIGVNTDFNVRRHVEVLEKIKPILKKASDIISHNSLISGVIENVPKFISTCDEQTLKANPQENKLEHGEDKTIVYLPKNRAATKTRSIECQTNLSLIQQTKASRYRRRRTSSSSSCSSDSSDKSRKSRTSSRYSRRRNSDSSRSSSRSSRSSNSCGSHSSSSSYSSRSSNRSRSRSSSPRYTTKEKEHKERERLLEVEERRVIYVGRISPGTTRDDLRKRFNKFGPITNISLHARSHGYMDNYGFVTFANKLDAYEAIEHGNDDPWQPKYDLSFGGRRIFCQTTYSDLDNVRDESGYFAQRGTEDSFDALLKDVQEKLRKRKV